MLLALAATAQSQITLTTVVTFDRTNGYLPQDGLILGSDGNLYGSLSYGGWYDGGTVFRISPDGRCVTLATFGEANGSHPDSLIQGKDGNFYGTTLEGGQFGNGSIFKMTPEGTLTTLATFGYDNGYGPGGLVQGKDGNLYGRMSTFREASTFKVALDGKLTIPATNGMPIDKNGNLLKASDGNSYGTTFSAFGANPPTNILGTVFRMSPDGTRTNLVVFKGANGANPLPGLVQAGDGNIYGITTGGGAFNQGTVFRLNLTGASEPADKARQINVPVLLHAMSNELDLSILDSMDRSIRSHGKIVTEGSNGIPGVSKSFGLALEYAWEVHTGHAPPERPTGVSTTELSNAYSMVILWASSIPPRPINFYGTVVDESNQPVMGAIAHFQWDGGITNRDPRPFTDTGMKSVDMTTDDAGLFSLTNVVGSQLDVSVGKDGYYASVRNRGLSYFKYSEMNFESFHGIDECFKPDANQPVVYHLRRMGTGANTLVTSQLGMREEFGVNVPRDGTPVEVDLLNRKSGSGPLKIGQIKPDYPAHGGTVQNLSPSDRAKLTTATNWSFTMKFANGGFLEENEEFPFNPPESGYQPVVTYNFNKTETNWTTELKRDFYVKFGSPPLYGHLHVETGSYRSTVFLTYVINPDGSRNLESKQPRR